MATETQTLSRVSKRAQLNKERREYRNKSRVPKGQIAGGGTNLAFDNGMSANKEKEDKGENSNSSGKKGDTNNTESSGNEGMNYRQVMALEKKKQKKKAKKKKKKSATYQGSKQVLTMSWRALLPSWFTSIFIIDIFAFLHVVLPKFFCALGEEWESPIAAMAGGEKGSSTKSAMMKSVEPMIVILINILVLVIIAIILVSLALIVEAITDPIGFVSTLMGALWESIKSAFGG
jgi:hypothetical protein